MSTEPLLLRSGSTNQAIFLIGDGALETSSLAQIDSALAVYQLSARVAAASGLRTVQGIAAYLRAQVRSVQKDGPYRLVGRGLEGVLAYELAVQLLGVDESVSLLGMIGASCLDWPTRFRARSVAPGQAADPQSAVLQRAVLEYDVPKSPLTMHLFASDQSDASTGWDAVVQPSRVVRVPIAASSAVFDSALWGAAELAAIGSLLAQAPTNPRPSAAPLHEAAYLTIQSGTRHVAPVFCVPGAGASATDFVALAGALGATRTVHGFQARGMDGTCLPHTSVEAAARVYLKGVANHCPRGPLSLVGHSFGGWVAFEMALRLQAAGRVVASLTLLDSDYPGGLGRVGKEYTRPEALLSLVSLYEQAAERSLDICLADFEQRDPVAQLAFLHARLVRTGLLPVRSTPAALTGAVSSFEAALRTQYRPQGSFAGNVTLVLVPEVGESAAAAEQRFDRVAAGWRGLAPKLQVRRGSGNHVTLLKQANVSALAQWVSEYDALQRAAAELPASLLGLPQSVPGAPPSRFRTNGSAGGA